MAFHNQSFHRRFQRLGDEAEHIFETSYPQHRWARLGINRPPFNLSAVGRMVRHIPDYLMATELVEVKGVGQDQQLKIKVDEWGCLQQWQTDMPVAVFIWDSHLKRSTIVPLKLLIDVVADPHGGVTSNHFHDGHLHLRIPLASLVGATWTVRS